MMNRTEIEGLTDGRSCQASELALEGGSPTRRAPWPTWPRHDQGTERALLEALRSGRWTVSGDSGPLVSRERTFAERFARYLGSRYGVATCNGSSAIVIALRALGVHAGDEVLLPALTWIGCAGAVLRLGAIPRFVDCERGGLAMSVDAAADEMTSKTKAILLVHPYCMNADIVSFVALSRSCNVSLVEDCSHAHGARYGEHHVGTFGHVAVFSMQQSKVLTAGEGGAVVTDDRAIYLRLQQLRADGRVYDEIAEPGQMLLGPPGDVQGANFILPELQAALLLDRLESLRDENELRRCNALALNRWIRDVPGVVPLYPTVTGDLPPLYRYVLRLDPDLLCGRGIDWWVSALSAELSMAVERLYKPLPDSPALRPGTVTTLSAENRRLLLDNLRAARSRIPGSRHAYETCLAIPHRVFLGSVDDCGDVASAVSKLVRNGHLASGHANRKWEET